MVFELKPTDKTALFYIIGCLIGGAALWTLPYAGVPYTALWQAISITLLCAAVFMLIRYRLTSFRMKLTRKNDDAAVSDTDNLSNTDFVVERARGKRYVTECRLSLDTVRQARRIKTAELKILTDGFSLYRYTVNPGPEEGVLLKFYANGERIALYTDMPDSMLASLADAAARNVADDDN